MTVFTWLWLIAGFILLIKGADVFVDASVNIAKRLKIPNVVIGLTIVAIGTSAPEAVISVSAAIGGSSDMTVGNIVGSNIFNVMFILGLCALIKPMYVKLKDIARDYLIGVGAAVLVIAMMIIFTDVIPRFASGIMLALFAVYIIFVVRQALKNRETQATCHGADKPVPLVKNICVALLGVVVIVIGGQLTVTNAVTIALDLGMTERMVGLTILAVGTALPELVTSLMACKKGEMDMAIGNIVGSSIFNILFILGISGVILPLAITDNLIFDFAFLVAGSFAFLIFVCTGKKVNRVEGLLLVAAYIGYMIFISIG